MTVEAQAARRDHVELAGPTPPIEALLDTMNIV